MPGSASNKFWTVTLLTATLLVSGCDSVLTAIGEFGAQTPGIAPEGAPALCDEENGPLGELASRVTVGVLNDDEATGFNGEALVPWNDFLDAYRAGCGLE